MMEVKDSLRRRWHSSVECLVVDLRAQLPKSDSNRDDAIRSLSNNWLDKVVSFHGELHRAYHNMSHVEDVLASLDFLFETEPDASSRPTVDVAVVTLAAFFHDAIYNPKSSTNERDSADLFLEFASELSIILSSEGSTDEDDSKVEPSPDLTSSIVVSRVEQCIVATATHVASANQARQSNDDLLAAFLDADMSILGRDPSRYNQYAGCIRREYKFVDRNVYCQKRAEILDSFLPTVDSAVSVEGSENASSEENQHLYIFATKKGRDRWEEQARRNLKREIDMLRRCIIPCE
ncbi:hypothetical protein ACHAWF_005083 [Thalassiosira exigua]